MSDRELLEWAAAAFWAGEIDDVCTVEWGELDGCILYTHGDNQDHNGADRTFRWNPLEENHDAFELAVKLRLHIQPSATTDDLAPSVECYDTEDRYSEIFEVLLRDDPCEATRRAIVLVAASIGKAQAGIPASPKAAPPPPPLEPK
jgi:hypothetical protein